VIAFNKDDPRALLLHVADTRTGCDAKRLCLITRGDSAGGVGKGGNNGQGLAAILLMQLLLHRCKEGVEIDVDVSKAVGGSSGLHRLIQPDSGTLLNRYTIIIFALSSLLGTSI